MTLEREKYIRACSSDEAYIRSEVAACAKEIKDFKKELSYNTARRNSIWANNTVLKEHWKANALLLKIAKAKYMAVKRLLPKRKPAKIKGPYWKLKQAGPSMFLAICSECGDRIHTGRIADVEQYYKTCRNCGAATDGKWKCERGKEPWTIKNKQS